MLHMRPRTHGASAQRHTNSIMQMHHTNQAISAPGARASACMLTLRHASLIDNSPYLLRGESLYSRKALSARNDRCAQHQMQDWESGFMSVLGVKSKAGHHSIFILQSTTRKAALNRTP